jgi:hypothetical protein
MDAQSLSVIGLTDYLNNPTFSQYDGRDYAIAIIDSGLTSSDPVFGGDQNNDGVPDRVVFQKDYVENDDIAQDEVFGGGHGTAVASIIAEAAPGADLIILRVLDFSGGTNDSRIEQALNWVNVNRTLYNIVAVNLSLGYTDTNFQTDQSTFAIHDDLAVLANAGIACIAATGNSHSLYNLEDSDLVPNPTPGVEYPAADASVIAVGATWAGDYELDDPFFYTGGHLDGEYGAYDHTQAVDRIAAFSQRHETMLDVFAPGTSLYAPVNSIPPQYGYFQGTSMAAPHVTAAVAIAQQLNDEFQFQTGRLSKSQLVNLLQSTGVTIYDGDEDMDGMLDPGDENDNIVNTNTYYKRLDVEAMAYKLFKPATAPDLVFASDWGFSDTDDNTGDTTPTFTGTAPAGSHVWLYVDGNPVADTQLGAGVTTYNLTPTTPLSTTGSWSVTVRVAADGTVAAANRSQPSNALVVSHTESQNLGSSFTGKLSDTLFVSGSNSGSSTLTISWVTSGGSPPRSLTKTGTGTTSISQISDRTDSVTYNNQNGTTNFGTDAGVAATQVGHTRVANWSVDVSLGTGASSSNVVFNTTQNLAAISVDGTGAIAKMAAHGSHVLVVDSVAVTSGGKLDLFDNDLILRANSTNEVTQYNDLYALIVSGYNSGAWTGTGVMSTSAGAAGGSTALALVRNSQLPFGSFTTFSGQLVSSYDILIKYTYTADADITGLVDDSDSTIITASYDPTGSGMHWWLGDSNYDGVVDDADITFLGANYDPNGTPL